MFKPQGYEQTAKKRGLRVGVGVETERQAQGQKVRERDGELDLRLPCLRLGFHSDRLLSY